MGDLQSRHRHRAETPGGPFVSATVAESGPRFTRMGTRAGVVYPGDPPLDDLLMSIAMPLAGGSSSGCYIIQDGGLPHGVFLRVRGDTPLEHGDVIAVGRQLFRFELVGGAKEAPKPETQSRR